MCNDREERSMTLTRFVSIENEQQFIHLHKSPLSMDGIEQFLRPITINQHFEEELRRALIDHRRSS